MPKDLNHKIQRLTALSGFPDGKICRAVRVNLAGSGKKVFWRYPLRFHGLRMNSNRM